MKLIRKRQKAKQTTNLQISQTEVDLDDLIQLSMIAMAAVIVMGAVRYIMGDTLAEPRLSEVLGDKAIGKALLCLRVPLPKIELINGELLAYRKFNYGGGYLTSTVQNYKWREQNFADEPPSMDNTNGLYATRLEPRDLMEGRTRDFLPSGGTFKVELGGLVKLSGVIIEHNDGVLRAECARLVCIWVISSSPFFPTNLISDLHTNYPNTPIYVCTREQVLDALFRVAARV